MTISIKIHDGNFDIKIFAFSTKCVSFDVSHIRLTDHSIF